MTLEVRMLTTFTGLQYLERDPNGSLELLVRICFWIWKLVTQFCSVCENLSSFTFMIYVYFNKKLTNIEVHIPKLQHWDIHVLPISQGNYPFCDIVCNIQKGKWCYSQYGWGCSTSVILFVISKGEIMLLPVPQRVTLSVMLFEISKGGDDVTPNITGGLPSLWYLVFQIITKNLSIL